MKKPVLIGISVLGLAVAAVGVLYLTIDPNRFRDQIAGELQKQLHRPVTMGKMGLSLFPLAVRVEDLSIGERAAFPSNRPFAAARSIDVRADLFALLGGRITVDALTLVSPVIELAKNPAGEWNFADLTSQSGSGGKPVTLDLLRIEDGSIGVTDLAQPAARAVYQHLDIEVTGVAPGRRMGIKAALKLPGDKGGAMAFEGTGPAPFDGKLTATGASISSLTSFAGGTPTVDGALTGTTTIRSAKDKMTLSGHLDLANATAMSKPLGVPVAADFEVTDDDDTGILSASSLTITAGKVAVRGAGQYDTRSSTVSAKMNLANAGLAEVLALTRLFGGPDAEGTGMLSLDVAVHGPISAPEYTGNGQLQNATVKLATLTQPLGIKSAAVRFDGRKATISNLDASVAGTNIKGNLGVSNFESPALAFDLDADKLDVAEWQKLPAATPASGGAKGSSAASGISAKGNLHVGALLSQGLQLTNVRAQAVYQNSQLTLSPLSAQLFGGTQLGSLVADLRPQLPTVALELKLANVDTNQLLSATTSLKNMLYGALAASGGLRLQLGSADMARTLNGALNLNIANGRLAGTNIMNELAQVGKFMGYQANPQGATAITQLGGDIEIKDGVANTKNLQMVMDTGSLAAAGTINLVDQSINLKADAVLGKAMAQKLAAGGAVTAFLTNSKGELVLPVNITGTFAKPNFVPDPARLLEMKAKNLIPGGLTPQGIAGAFGRGGKNPGKSLVDALSGKAPDAPQTPKTPDPQPPPSPAQSIIDLFHKKK